MALLTNTHRALLGVLDADGKRVRIAPGKTEDVKGSFAAHPFVKEGWLEVGTKPSKSNAKPEKVEPQKAEQETPSE